MTSDKIMPLYLMESIDKIEKLNKKWESLNWFQKFIQSKHLYIESQEVLFDFNINFGRWRYELYEEKKGEIKC